MRSSIQTGLAALVLAGLGVTACQDDGLTPPDPQFSEGSVQARIERAEQIARAEIEKAVQRGNNRGFEHTILRMEADVPSIGGMYYDSDAGETVVIITHKADADRAVAAAEREYLEPARSLMARAAPNARGAVDAEFEAPVVTRIGEYPFSKLVGWREILLPDLFQDVPAFVSIDANERSNRVEIGIETDDARAAVDRVLEANGVPAEAVTIVKRQRPSFAIALPPLEAAFTPRLIRRRHHHLKHPHAYMGAGLQIQRYRGPTVPPSECSQGWTASYDEPNSHLDTWGYLTAGHCVDGTGNGGGIGQQWWHPSDPQAFPNEPAGINFGRVHINKPHPSGGAIADAAFLAANDWRTGAEKRVAITTRIGRTDSNGTLDIDYWHDWFFAGSGRESPGTRILKTGRTTGTTAGEIVRSGETVSFVGGFVVRNLIVTTNAEVRPGDSGGPMFTENQFFTYALGITVGARGRPDCTAPCQAYFSPLWAIDDHIGRDLKIQPS